MSIRYTIPRETIRDWVTRDGIYLNSGGQCALDDIAVENIGKKLTEHVDTVHVNMYDAELVKVMDEEVFVTI
jgi:hypothetical protein